MKRKFLASIITIALLIASVPLTCFAAFDGSPNYSSTVPASNSDYITYSQGESITLEGVIDHSLEEVVCGLAPYDAKTTDVCDCAFSHYVPNKKAFTYLGVATLSKTDVSNGKLSLFPGQNTFVKTTVSSSIDTTYVKTGSYRFFVIMVYSDGYGMSYYYQDVEVVKPAVPTNATVLINGTQIGFQAYNIDGSNYFKLRDLAYSLNDTKKQFNVTWDSANNAIVLTKNSPYTTVGGEMTGSGSGSVTPIETGANIYLDSINYSLFAYNIENNNYFKLRDIAEIFDFSVAWDSTNNAINIDTSKSYSN